MFLGSFRNSNVKFLLRDTNFFLYLVAFRGVIILKGYIQYIKLRASCFTVKTYCAILCLTHIFTKNDCSSRIEV